MLIPTKFPLTHYMIKKTIKRTHAIYNIRYVYNNV